MGIGAIEATVNFGKTQYTLNDILGTLTHHRGWKYPSSYVVVELNNPHTEVINEFMNYGKITIKYGKDGNYSGPFDMVIVSVANEIEFSNVKVRLLAVEPGFIKLAEKHQIKSYPNQTVSGVLAQMCGDVGLSAAGIKKTAGNYTYIQPNISNMQFVAKYLVPIATDTSKSAPYLFTIDNNVMHCRPPNLAQEPKYKFFLDSSKENVVKRFSVKNAGMESDMVVGTEYKTYGYDFTQKGTLTHKDFAQSVNQSFLNKKKYESEFSRTRTMPYAEQWMLDAHNRNEIARGQFVVMAEALIVGENAFFFDQIYQFTNLIFEREPSEYSGKYYVHSLVNTLKRRFFVTQLNLYTNAFLKGQKTPAQSPSK
jgi:hypothetical protein